MGRTVETHSPPLQPGGRVIRPSRYHQGYLGNNIERSKPRGEL
jgi:hypothetical protein